MPSQDAGAIVVDPADIPTIDQINAGAEEITVLVYEFKRDLNAYLATRTGLPARTMAEVIAFNLAHEEEELKWFGQQWLELVGVGAVHRGRVPGRPGRGPRASADPTASTRCWLRTDLDAIVAPTGSPAWPTDLVNGDHFLGASSGPAAVAGYPLITVPAGDAFGLPVGLTFMGTAYSEPALITLAHGFEQATMARRRPEYLATLPTNGSRPRSPRQAALPAVPARAGATAARTGLDRCGHLPPLSRSADGDAQATRGSGAGVRADTTATIPATIMAAAG